MFEALLFSTAVTVNTKLPPLPTEAAGIVIVSFTANPTPPLCTTTEPSVALPFVTVIVKTAEAEKDKILDIACNDGSQLDQFKRKGWKTFGVDPAENLFELSSIKHKVYCDYWNEKLSYKIKEKFEVITAQNVFAHVDDTDSFLRSCSNVLHENGFVFIQTSQADMIKNNEFDTIYHEHVSFFNTKSMKYCCNKNGFSLIDVLLLKIL